jgi:hypothetical protein
LIKFEEKLAYIFSCPNKKYSHFCFVGKIVLGRGKKPPHPQYKVNGQYLIKECYIIIKRLNAERW